MIRKIRRIQHTPAFNKFFTSYSTYILIFCKFFYILTILFSKQLRSVLRCGKVSTGVKRHCLVFLKPDVKKNESEVMLAGRVVVVVTEREAVDPDGSLLFVPVLAASSCRVHIRVRDVSDGEAGHVGGGDGEAGVLHGWFRVRGFGDGAGRRGV